MNNKYNVMITYAGEGTFKFNLRKIGEVEISMTRPVYIYNADVDTINNLRALKRMLININIGVKPTGAYRIFNMDDYETPKNVQIRSHVAENYREPVSNAEISSILKGGSTVAVTEETSNKEKPKKENKKDETKKETKPKRTRKTSKK